MKHPTLEGHPAWEAHKRAPVDERPVSEEEREAVNRARLGSFTTDYPVDPVEVIYASADAGAADAAIQATIVGDELERDEQ